MPERSDWGESAVLNIQIYRLLLLLLVPSQAFKTVEQENLLSFLLSRCPRMPVVIFIGSASSVAAIFIFIGAALVSCIKQKPCQK